MTPEALETPAAGEIPPVTVRYFLRPASSHITSVTI